MKTKQYRIIPMEDDGVTVAGNEILTESETEAILALTKGHVVYMAEIEWTRISIQINRVREPKKEIDA